MFLAGAGVKQGDTGATDEYGIRREGRSPHTNDLHATLLALAHGSRSRAPHLPLAARDFRLTGVAGEAATEIFA